MKPTWYDYEAEEYDLDNIYNEEDDRRDNGTSQYATYGQYGTAADSGAWND